MAILKIAGDNCTNRSFQATFISLSSRCPAGKVLEQRTSANPTSPVCLGTKVKTLMKPESEFKINIGRKLNATPLA
jgi:hypothetical protein